MKVLKDNYNTNSNNDNQISPYPKKILCDKCRSELECEQSDIRIGAYGCWYVNCPLCGSENILDEDCDMLTLNNVEFPTHFHRTSKDTGAVDCCNNENIKEYIHKAINYFRNNKDEFCWYTETGNLHICIFRYDGDEMYEIVVANDYYNTYINFEEEDYNDDYEDDYEYDACEYNGD